LRTDSVTSADCFSGISVVFSGRLQRWRPLLRWGAGVGVAGLLSISAVQAREQAPALPPVAVSALPAAKSTQKLFL